MVLLAARDRGGGLFTAVRTAAEDLLLSYSALYKDAQAPAGFFLFYLPFQHLGNTLYLCVVTDQSR